MKVSVTPPSPATVHTYWQQLAQLPHSYSEQRSSLGELPPGYDHDCNRICIGHSPEAFEAGRSALKSWQMFPGRWTRVYPSTAPLSIGQEVVVLFHLFGLWWYNGCRIVYTIDEPGRFGFAYGTLKGHVECGEEQFMVYRDKDGRVWYQITAFSRPALWISRLGYPIARWFQRRFVRESMLLMQQAAQSPAYA